MVAETNVARSSEVVALSEINRAGNRRLRRILWPLTVVCFLGPCTWAQQSTASVPPDDPVVMTVGQKKITAAELCRALERLPPPQRSGYVLHPELAEQWYGPLVALAEEARREQLGGSFEAENLSEVDRDNALAGELIQRISRQAEPTEPQIESFYQTHKSDFEEAKARHIQISYKTALASRSARPASEAKAKIEGIASKLRHGADFQTLAVGESEDPETKAKGGDLGYVRRRQLEPSVDKVLWSLAAGQTSAPFEGRFGYEIIRVEERRSLPLASVRESIVGTVKAQALETREREIVDSAHIRLEQAYVNSALPCQVSSPSFSLPDRLDLR